MGDHECTSVKRSAYSSLDCTWAWACAQVAGWSYSVLHNKQAWNYRACFGAEACKLLDVGKSRGCFHLGNSQLLIRLIGWTLSQYNLPVDLMANICHTWLSQFWRQFSAVPPAGKTCGRSLVGIHVCWDNFSNAQEQQLFAIYISLRESFYRMLLSSIWYTISTSIL